MSARLMLAPLRAMTRVGRDAAYADFTAQPWAGVLVAIWYNASLGLISFLLQMRLVGSVAIWHHYTVSVTGSAIIWLSYFLMNVLLLPLYGILVGYGLRRVMGADMPVESVKLGVPLGVWLSLAWSAPILGLVTLLFGAMVVQPWLPSLGVFGRAGFHSLAVVGYIVPLYMVRIVYGIPHRSAAGRRLSLIVVSPAILVAILGIVLAIAFGMHQTHQRENVTGLAADPSVTTSCNELGPMQMPLAPRPFGATVIGAVPPSAASAAIDQGQRHVNGQIDQDYYNSPRVAVHPDAAPFGVTVMAVVPVGMRVIPGQHIIYTTGYADPKQPCHYLPNFVKSLDE